MNRFLVAVLTLVASPAASVELDDRYALAGDGDTAICTTIASLKKWYALASANRAQEALAMPECVLLTQGDKVLIVERDMAGYTRGMWTSPDGGTNDVWMVAYPNMTQWDFAVFDCTHHTPKCTRDVYEAVKNVLPPYYEWKPSN
ncbi:hypothetical protein [Mesorhizobium mediterraneum]|uniref:hypothetical protein n=1 Tax=Mesorhizobium mediterraneum TaxID=43617 RepID=UPI0017818F29|nr:hypothetical protein [Mesorhizobium mediterraneum]